MRAYTGTVAITGLNATDNPGPGVAVARALRADPAFQGRVVGLAYDVMDPGLFQEGLFDASFLVPYPSAGREALFARLADITARLPIDVLLPTLDSELPALIGQEDRLATLGIRAFLPDREAFDRRSKARLDELRERHGVPVPRGEVLHDAGPLTRPRTFPVAVKGVFYGAEICWTADEAIAAFHRAAAKWGLPVIVQDVVPGEEFNVCAVGDGTGATVGAVGMKKLVLTDKGKGWAGVTVADPRLLDLADQVVRALRWRGPCEIEARRADDGSYQLLEVNPRFPAWCDLTAGAGQNQVLAVTRLASGEPVAPLPPARPGVAFVRISIDQIVDLGAIDALATRGELWSRSLQPSGVPHATPAV